MHYKTMFLILIKFILSFKFNILGQTSILSYEENTEALMEQFSGRTQKNIIQVEYGKQSNRYSLRFKKKNNQPLRLWFNIIHENVPAFCFSQCPSTTFKNHEISAFKVFSSISQPSSHPYAAFTFITIFFILQSILELLPLSVYFF